MKPQGRARKAYFTEKMIQSKQKGTHKWRKQKVDLLPGALGFTTWRRCFKSASLGLSRDFLINAVEYDAKNTRKDRSSHQLQLLPHNFVFFRKCVLQFHAKMHMI
jgi:hypothetical protein